MGEFAKFLFGGSNPSMCSIYFLDIKQRNKMKILILEDSILRMNHFRKKFKNDEIIHTDNAHKAIEYIKENDLM